MALPANGTISMNNIRAELGIPTQSPFSLDTATNGGYVAINPCSPSKPNSANPDSISEWYGYCHTCTCTPTPTPTPGPTATPTPTPTPIPSTAYTIGAVTGTNPYGGYPNTSGPCSVFPYALPLNVFSVTSTFQNGMSLFMNSNRTTAFQATNTTDYFQVQIGGTNYYFTYNGTVQNLTACPTPTPTATPTNTPTATPTGTPTPTPAYNSFLLAYSATSGLEACSRYPTLFTNTYYTNASISVLSNGVTIYQNTALTNPAGNGFYSNGTNYWNTSAGSGNLQNQTSCATPTPTPTPPPTPTPTPTFVTTTVYMTGCSKNESIYTGEIPFTVYAESSPFSYGTNPVSVSTSVIVYVTLYAEFGDYSTNATIQSGNSCQNGLYFTGNFNETVSSMVIDSVNPASFGSQQYEPGFATVSATCANCGT